MAIYARIYKVQATNKGKKSVILYLSNNDPELSYREVEVVLDRSEDEIDLLNNATQKQLTTLWNRGDELDELDYKLSIRNSHKEFSKRLLINAFEALQANDIDTSYGLLVDFLDNNTAMKSQLLSILQNLDAVNGATIGKRERIMWFIMFSMVNSL